MYDHSFQTVCNCGQCQDIQYVMGVYERVRTKLPLTPAEFRLYMRKNPTKLHKAAQALFNRLFAACNDGFIRIQ